MRLQVKPIESTSVLNQIDPASLAVLPRTCGVYVFKGTSRLPLYIGKSVDIRSRVLAHLRAEDEARMIAQTRRVDYVETAGEIGALLLEARLIKEQSPLFNVRLRRLKTLCAVRLSSGPGGLSPEIVSGDQLSPGQTSGLYGLFGSVHAARSILRDLAGRHALCLGLLGLEKLGRRGCFGLQLKTCRGACVGGEDRSAHDRRLLEALEHLTIHTWPFSGAVDLVERRGDWVQRHRILHWRYLGTWCSRSNQLDHPLQTGFDLDTYKILVKPIMIGSVRIEPV